MYTWGILRASMGDLALPHLKIPKKYATTVIVERSKCNQKRSTPKRMIRFSSFFFEKRIPLPRTLKTSNPPPLQNYPALRVLPGEKCNHHASRHLLPFPRWQRPPTGEGPTASDLLAAGWGRGMGPRDGAAGWGPALPASSLLNQKTFALTFAPFAVNLFFALYPLSPPTHAIIFLE